MKIHSKYIGLLLIIFAGISAGTGCSKDRLIPEPLSFYEPDLTYTTPDAMKAALTSCNRNLRNEYYGDNPPILTEMVFSEVTVEGTTDKSGPAQDLNLVITPDLAGYNDADHARIYYYWSEGYKGIKYANTIISRIDNVTWDSPEQRNSFLGQAYFHRAMRYYRLTNQFGDVPAIMHEVSEKDSAVKPFYSTKRDVILRKMKTDLDSAKDWVSDDVNRGEVTKGAVLQLLTKVNLALGEFDDAIASASAIIDGGKYHLMMQPFGATKKNVIWDLHRPENKYIGENTEGIYLVTDHYGDGSYDGGTSIMRQAVPYWGTNITTPSGKKGTNDGVSVKFVQSALYGRGIGRCRPTNYSQYDIWTDSNDLRHSHDNWMNMEDLLYNNDGALVVNGVEDPYYMKPLQKYNSSGGLLCVDTIRSWFGWPQYKIFIPDNEHSPMTGGHSDWYVYRLAETYLLRAEAYFWKGDLASAAADINMVRTRAHCAPITPDKVNMGTILDERARELFYEEPRKTELTRIAYIFALTHKVAENGKSYSLENFSDANYFYDRIIARNNFYREGNVTLHGDKYTISPYHVLWPVPTKSIQANTYGRINQNKGYQGYESNVPALDYIP